MKNLKNNKIYNLARLSMLVTAGLSIIIIALRIFLPNAARKFYLISSYMSWMLIDSGYGEYQNTHLSGTLIKLITTCVLSVLIYLICYLASKKSVYFLIGALAYYLFDSYLYLHDTIYFNAKGYFAVGLIYRIVFVIAMLVGIYYGVIGRKIEMYVDDEEIAPDIRFTNKDFSRELSLNRRTIKFKRSKEFLNSYIYLQIVVDDRHKCYLLNGEEQEIILDGNTHRIKVISHFASIRSVYIKLPQGNEDKSYMLSFETKFLFLKKLIVQEVT